MKTTVTGVMTALIIGMSVLSQPAQGQSCSGAIENGGFESSVPSNGSGNGWTSRNIDGAGGWRSLGGDAGGVFCLNDGGALQTDPCIETTITGLCAGVRYRLSGRYQSFYQSGFLSNAFQCFLDGTVIVSAPGGPVGVWRRWEHEFTATDSTATLRLCGECSGTDDDFAVDAVNIVSLGFAISRQPVDAAVGVDVPVVFFLDAYARCDQPLRFQWQRRVPSVPDETAPGAWVDLTDGGGIMNATTGALTITQPTPGLATGFRCRISSPCFSEVLYSQTVNFSVACPADFNADGGVDFGDVEAFFERWENGC